MAPESASWEASPTSAGPSLETSACLLVTTALGQWPDPLAKRLGNRASISIETLASSDFDEHTLLLLGYEEPAACLATLLSHCGELDIQATLERWRVGCLRMLELCRQRPDQCLLLNLSRLDSSALALLSHHLQDHGISATDPYHPPSTDDMALEPPVPPLLPQVVSHYLAQRSDLSQLYADLEGYAELLGRDPEFARATPIPCGLPLAELLLREWLNNRHDQLRRSTEMHDELAALRFSCMTLEGLKFKAEEELQQTLTSLETAQTEFGLMELAREAQAQRADDAESQLRELNAEHELIFQQQKQLQQELSHSFHEHQKAMRHHVALQERLAEQECLNQNAEQDLKLARERLESLQLELEQSCLAREIEGQRADTAESLLREVEDQRDFSLLQQRQLQEELSHFFQEHQKACHLRNASEERLARLEHECRLLFLNSRLNAGFDRNQFAMILELMRRSLHV